MFVGCCETDYDKSSGALESKFFQALLRGLDISPSELPGDREDRTCWPRIKVMLTDVFKTKTRDQWGEIFNGSDACCTPVLTSKELEDMGYDMRPAVTLKRSPALALVPSNKGGDAAVGQGPGVMGGGYEGQVLLPGPNGESLLRKWTGWSKGEEYLVDEDESLIDGRRSTI